MSDFLGANAWALVARLLAFATAIPFHEAAHAFVSDKLGDSSAKEQGRLSLNPIRHLDPFGFLAMLIIGVGWAKPVTVHPERYKNPRVGMAITAVAGPLANLLLAYINVVLYKIVVYSGWMATGAELAGWVSVVADIIYFLAIININLAVFNMLPIPPFDGSRLFGLLLPEKWYFKVMKYERIIMFGVLILVWFGFLSRVLGVVNQYVMIALNWLSGYVDMIFNFAASRL